jgi:hypothetical protein
MENAESSAPLGDSESDDAPGFGMDKTPLGDTEEHAGAVSEEGHLESDPEEPDEPDESEDESEDGEQRPRRPKADPDAAAHTARPGEGEGRQRLEFEGEQPPPASERLADREA